MIVTLTGAFRNVGDHLIGERAQRLLRTFVDEDIVNLRRTDIGTADYDTMNRARAVILCGGPGYQQHMYPRIYPLDLEKLQTPVVPLGLGWKGGLHDCPDQFAFSAASQRFIEGVHNGIRDSSCRDHYTVEILGNMGIRNVVMTGCPAWYDPDYLEQDFRAGEPRNIVFSDPAAVNRGTLGALRHVRSRFPKATLTLALHHGYYPRLARSGLRFALQHGGLAAYARSIGVRIANLAADLDGMQSLYDQCDLHIGYRVHAHIFCLSHRTPSYLIAEDSRGAGQCIALGCPVLKADDPELGTALDAAFDRYLAAGAREFEATVTATLSGYQRMRDFLQNIEVT